MDSNFEMGDNLINLASKAKDWFISNNVVIPKTAAEWQRKAVSRGEIPDGCTTASLRRKGINVSDFIAEILNTTSQRNNRNPITKENCLEYTGLIYEKYEVVSGHKKIHITCSKCNRQDILDYGTLQRMYKASNKFCRYCRNAGGKIKDLERYNKEEATAIGRDTSNIEYECNICHEKFTRTRSYAGDSQYVVCPSCYPSRIIGTRVDDPIYGKFNSLIELKVYMRLLEILPASDIVKQAKYTDILNTGTQHTADFYIPKLNLILEVTTKSNGLGIKYENTKEWKLSLSPMVKFIYSDTEVDDIVRPLLKSIVG